MFTLETSQERNKLLGVLNDVFTPPEFKEFLLNDLEKKLTDYTSENKNFPEQLMEVVAGLWKQGFYPQLLVRLEAKRPNREVREFLAKYQVAPQAAAAGSQTP